MVTWRARDVMQCPRDLDHPALSFRDGEPGQCGAISGPAKREREKKIPALEGSGELQSRVTWLRLARAGPSLRRRLCSCTAPRNALCGGPV